MKNPETNQPPEFRLVSEGQDAVMGECPVQLFDDIATSGPKLQLRARSGSVVQLQPGSVLFPLLLLLTKALENTQDQELSYFLEAMTLLGAVVMSRPSTQLGSDLRSRSCIVCNSHVESQG